MRKYKLLAVSTDTYSNVLKEDLILKIDNFKLKFPDFSLEVPNLEFYTAKIYLLTGNNGTGKSSFLKTLAGLTHIKFNSSNLIRNNVLSELSTKEKARFVSYMPQVYATPDISVFNFLLHARYPLVKGLSGFTAEDLNKVNKIIEYFNIEYLRNRQFSSLSGGEQLRVLMARIYVLDPKIILFDEPTSFLDKPSRKEFVKHVQDLKEKGKTVIIVSHDDYLFDDIVDLELKIITM